MKARWKSKQCTITYPAEQWTIRVPTTDLAKKFQLKDVSLGYGNAVLAKYHDQPRHKCWITFLTTGLSVFVSSKRSEIDKVELSLSRAGLSYDIIESKKRSKDNQSV